MYEDEIIERFQDKLLLIRKVVGWSEEEFGQQIGVTRQTINNLEKKKKKLTKTQYIAMRHVLNEEIVRSEEDTEMLRCLLETIIDNPDKYDEKSKKKILEKANLLAPAIITKTSSRKEVSNEFKEVLEAIGISVSAIAVASIVGIVGNHFLKGKK